MGGGAVGRQAYLETLVLSKLQQIIGYCRVSHSSSASQTPETLNVLAESDVNASDVDHAARALQL